MREEFRALISGWMLTDDFDTLTEIIERSAKWAERNSPLLPDEQGIVKLMIERQILIGPSLFERI